MDVLNWFFRRWVVGLVVVMAVSVGNCAPAMEQWRTTLPAPVVWQQVSELGTLLVGTRQGIYGIEPDDGRVSWHVGDISHDASIEPLAGSPFLKIIDGEVMYLLDPVTGHVPFNSRAAGVSSVDEFYFLFETNNVLVKGASNQLAQAVAVLVDMQSGKVVWQQTLDLGKVLAVKSLANDELLIVTLFDIFNLDRLTGEIRWRKPTLPNLQMSGSDRLNQFMMRFAEEVFKNDQVAVDYIQRTGTNELFLAVGSLSEATSHHISMDVSSGERFWTREIRNTYPGFQRLVGGGILTMPYYFNRDTFVLGANRVNLLSTKTGEGQWGKKGQGLKIKGGVTHVYPVGEELVLTSYNGRKTFIYRLDPVSGTISKPVDIKGHVIAAYPAPSGRQLFCFMQDGINLLDLDAGKFVWRKDVQSRPSLTQKAGDTIYAYDEKDRRLKHIDTRSGVVNTLSDKFRFEGKESPAAIEIRDAGIFISSSQNLILLGHDGKTVYQQHLAAPRRAGWIRALYYAQGIRAAIISAQSYYVTGAMVGAALTPEFQELDIGNRSIVAGIAGAYGEQAQAAQSVASESFRRANERFKATRESQQYQVVLTQQDKRVVLAYVDKDTGDIHATVDMGDEKDPRYALDPISNQAYLLVDAATIKALLP